VRRIPASVQHAGASTADQLTAAAWAAEQALAEEAKVSKGSNRRPGKGFESNYEAIFGTGGPKRGSYVQDPETGKLVPKQEYVPKGPDAPYIQGCMEEFVSPIDRTVIADRAQLRAHNKRHGVTNSADYSANYLQKRVAKREADRLGTTKQAKKERLNLINETLKRHGL
jgi:hypothetical protein